MMKEVPKEMRGAGVKNLIGGNYWKQKEKQLFLKQ